MQNLSTVGKVGNAIASVRRAAIASFVALPLFGCAAMLAEPLPSEQDIRVDTALVGIWDADGITINVGEGNRRDEDSRFQIIVEGDHHVIEEIGEDGGARFKAYASLINDTRYLSLNLKSLVDAEIEKELGDGAGDSSSSSGDTEGLYLVFEYELTGNRLAAWTVDMEEVLDAVDDGDIDGDIDSGCDLDLKRLAQSNQVDEDDREGLEWAEDFLGYGFICKTIWADQSDLLKYIQTNGTKRSDSEEMELKREGTHT